MNFSVFIEIFTDTDSIDDVTHIHRVPKKGATLFSAITLALLSRFL